MTSKVQTVNKFSGCIDSIYFVQFESIKLRNPSWIDGAWLIRAAHINIFFYISAHFWMKTIWSIRIAPKIETRSPPLGISIHLLFYSSTWNENHLLPIMGKCAYTQKSVSQRNFCRFIYCFRSLWYTSNWTRKCIQFTINLHFHLQHYALRFSCRRNWPWWGLWIRLLFDFWK